MHAGKVHRATKGKGREDPYGRAHFRQGLLSRYPNPSADEVDDQEYRQEGCLDRLTLMQIACYEAMVGATFSVVMLRHLPTTVTVVKSAAMPGCHS